jgi:hypothetical protein
MLLTCGYPSMGKVVNILLFSQNQNIKILHG